MADHERSDRRTAQRVAVNLPARWEGVLEQHDATVTSLSTNGCFLISGGEAELKELLRLEIYLPEDGPLYLWAEVVEAASEIGFAVRFTLVADEENLRLAGFIQQVLAQSG